MEFILRKTPLAKFLTNGKRVLDKKENLIRMTFFDNCLSLRVENSTTIYQLDIDCVFGNPEDKTSFLIDGRIIDASLKGADRDLVFELTDTHLICEELALSLAFEGMNVSKGNVKDKLSQLPFQDFVHVDEFYEGMVEANEYFIENTHYYSKYLKFKDMISTIFNPELVYIRTRKYNNHIGIDDHVGNDGVALHKDSIAFFIKSYKHTGKKTLQLCFMKDRNFFILKDENEFFCFRYNADIEFPELLKFQHNWTGETIAFSENNLLSIQEFAGKEKRTKIYLSIDNNKCTIRFDSDKVNSLSIDLLDGHFNMNKQYCFNYETFIKVMQNGALGKSIHLSTFTNYRGEQGDFWKIDDDNKYVFLSGYNISSGIDVSEETKALFAKQLESLEAELAILNKQNVDA